MTRPRKSPERIIRFRVSETCGGVTVGGREYKPGREYTATLEEWHRRLKYIVPLRVVKEKRGGNHGGMV